MSNQAVGLIGRKFGMTRVFTADGVAIPVTVLEVGQNRATQVKTVERDGYTAAQVTFGTRRPVRVNKPQAGHWAKAGVQGGAVSHEFRYPSNVTLPALGGTLTFERFKIGEKVDIQGKTIGKGFAGTIKRHHFSSNRASHGNSRSHNVPGSIGMAQDPGRVFPGKRMSGQLGNVMRTTQNLEIVRVDSERGLLLVKGAVPGHQNGIVFVSLSVKNKKGQNNEN